MAINITSANAPGVALGGLVQIKSGAQLIAEERKEREQAVRENQKPVVQGLAGHIRRCWSDARMAKENTVEPRMLQSLRQRRGEYDPDKLARIKEQGSSEIYMMLTSNKCRAASAWMRDVIITASGDKPWTTAPTPIPDIDPSHVQQIMETAQQQIMMQMQSGANPSDAEVRQMLLNMKDQALAQARQMAKEASERMEMKMHDQLQEGGWMQAMSEFIDDLTTFPSAIVKGPVVRMKPQLAWKKGPNGTFEMDVQDKLVMEWDRVDPFNAYPVADASRIEDGDFIERHRLERHDLVALKGVDGYSNKAINAVLSEHGRNGLHEWLTIDMTKAEIEGKSTTSVSSNPSNLIDALQYWGTVQGQMLLDWGMDRDEIEDPLAEYHIEAWLIGEWVIKASVNPDPLGRKPYYKASYEEVPGAFWGNSVADLCRDAQDVCNASARALVNNMGIASGPQVVYNVDRLPVGENITQLFPWKTWQVTSDPMQGTQPAMQFFQPQSLSQELLGVYERFSVMADEYTGIPRYMTGDSPAGGAGRTASGMSMLMSNAGKSIKQVIANIDLAVTMPLIERLYFFNMRFSEDADLKGDVKIVARGAQAIMQREAAQQRRNEFLQIALSNPIVNQVVGMEGIAVLLRESAKDLGMDVDQIVPSLPILKQRWAAAQAQALAQQQQQMQIERDAQGAITGAKMSPGQSAPGGTPAGPPSPGAQLQDGAPVANQFQPMQG